MVQVLSVVLWILHQPRTNRYTTKWKALPVTFYHRHHTLLTLTENTPFHDKSDMMSTTATTSCDTTSASTTNINRLDWFHGLFGFREDDTNHAVTAFGDSNDATRSGNDHQSWTVFVISICYICTTSRLVGKHKYLVGRWPMATGNAIAIRYPFQRNPGQPIILKLRSIGCTCNLYKYRYDLMKRELNKSCSNHVCIV